MTCCCPVISSQPSHIPSYPYSSFWRAHILTILDVFLFYIVALYEIPNFDMVDKMTIESSFRRKAYCISHESNMNELLYRCLKLHVFSNQISWSFRTVALYCKGLNWYCGDSFEWVSGVNEACLTPKTRSIRTSSSSEDLLRYSNTHLSWWIQWRRTNCSVFSARSRA